ERARRVGSHQVGSGPATARWLSTRGRGSGPIWSHPPWSRVRRVPPPKPSSQTRRAKADGSGLAPLIPFAARDRAAQEARMAERHRPYEDDYSREWRTRHRERDEPSRDRQDWWSREEGW